MIPYLFIIFAFLADRLTKWWAATYLAQHGPTKFTALFSLGETYNQGIAFGMLQGVGRWVGWLTVLIVLGMIGYMSRLPRSMGLLRLGLALVIGGAMGNLLDRVTTGMVLDFIVTPLRPGIFNVADLFIHLGLILAIIGTLRQGSSGTVESPSAPHPGVNLVEATIE
jgi:signal peptidase II